MSLRLKVHNGRTYVVDEESEFCVANLVPRYKLVYDGDVVGVIDYVEDAIPLLEKHFKANPPRWEWECLGTGYDKPTWYGVLTVERFKSGKWLAFRDGCALLRDGKRATFRSHLEAQRAADSHLHDDFPSANTSNDSLKWADYSLWPTIVNGTDVGPTTITVTGTLDGELDPIASPIPLSEWERRRIRGRAELALLQKAIGVATVKVLLALAGATTRTKSDLEQAVNLISIEVPRMLKLYRRAKQYRISFQAAAREQGGVFLREILPAAAANDQLLDRAINLPLEFLADWVRWDKDIAFRKQCAEVVVQRLLAARNSWSTQ
jgi:hypothetical protein